MKDEEEVSETAEAIEKPSDMTVIEKRLLEIENILHKLSHEKEILNRLNQAEEILRRLITVEKLMEKPSRLITVEKLMEKLSPQKQVPEETSVMLNPQQVAPTLNEEQTNVIEDPRKEIVNTDYLHESSSVHGNYAELRKPSPTPSEYSFVELDCDVKESQVVPYNEDTENEHEIYEDSFENNVNTSGIGKKYEVRRCRMHRCY